MPNGSRFGTGGFLLTTLKTSYTDSGFVILIVFVTLDIPLVLCQVSTCVVDENRAAREGLRILLSHFTPFDTLFKLDEKNTIIYKCPVLLGES